MNVVILGGYGVFGSRLALLLQRDGHQVWVAGRSIKKAERLVSRNGGKALQIDIRGDLRPLLTVRPDVVVDAAGPFPKYGDEPVPVAAYCLAHGINYLDLSDDGNFTSRVSRLNGTAKDKGCFALSGASSVPGLSSAVVQELALGLDKIESIDIAIVPGNRAPRSKSVVAGIMHRVGRNIQIWRGGQWRVTRCWSDPQRYHIGNQLRRRAWLIDVPDTSLFPAHFQARSVTFRAGLELGIINWSLSLLAVLRRIGLSPGHIIFVAIGYRMAAFLKPFGSDKGGMVVAVTGLCRGQMVTRRWNLVAQAGDGPFVPLVLIRALLRNISQVGPGARPCLAELPLSKIEEAMNDMDIKTTRNESTTMPLFQSALDDRWHILPASVRRLHAIYDKESFSGRADVTRGRGILARLAAWCFRFPRAGADVPLTITKIRTGAGETWERNFDGRLFRSYLTPSKRHHYKERFWAFTYEQELPVEDGALQFPIRRGWFMGIPLPRILMPRSNSGEYEVNGVFRFDVELKAPLTGALIVRYRGSVEPDGAR